MTVIHAIRSKSYGPVNCCKLHNKMDE